MILTLQGMLLHNLYYQIRMPRAPGIMSRLRPAISLPSLCTILREEHQWGAEK
jgi:hypothetical protein